MSAELPEPSPEQSSRSLADYMNQAWSAPNYPAFLRAARFYAGGLALMLASALLGSQFLAFNVWVSTASAGFILFVVGFVLAARAIKHIGREYPHERDLNNFRSSAVFAAMHDLIRRP